MNVNWISVKEKLPPPHKKPYYIDSNEELYDSDFVLVCCKRGKGHCFAIGQIIHDKIDGSYQWSQIYDYAECEIDDMDVLAWTPLPEPYKGE